MELKKVEMKYGRVFWRLIGSSLDDVVMSKDELIEAYNLIQNELKEMGVLSK